VSRVLAPKRVSHRLRRARTSVARADARLFHRLVGLRSPGLDHAMWSVSRAANRGALWLSIAGLLAKFGGRRGRRAAARGAVAIGITSAVVNGPLKLVSRRRRPEVALHLPRRGLIATPRSSSFPSGHAASAAAFATAVAAEYPRMAVPIAPLAALVAYSRVHTGVHYPGDVVAGAAVGAASGIVAGRVVRAVERRLEERRAAVGGMENGIPRRAVLLFSPHSGSAGGLRRARKALEQSGVEIVAQYPVHDADRLSRWVDRADEQPIVVIAAGGDGTVGAAADRVADSHAVLAVVPLGTSNDFARSIDLPIDPVDAARLVATGKVTAIDAGRLVSPGRLRRHFVHAATAGLNVSFARLATRASVRQRFGRLTYAVAGAMALREHDPFSCELRYDGTVEQLELLHLAVINAPVFGGFLGMRVSGASVDDRMLDVIAVERLPIRRLLLAALYPIFGVKRRVRGIRTLQVPALRVHTNRELDVALDGEILGKIPADFEVAGEALRVVTTRDFEGR
jgi:YegS/Rv2252/BmrU family lipid kinase